MTPIADLLICLRFFSRFPVPETTRERELGPRGFATAAPMAPLAGCVIGLVPAAILIMSALFGLPPTVAAALAIAALVASTGALHEDALADCADGFGGGRTRDAKLAIMRDSRIGAFGACVIGLSLVLRTAALAAIAARGLGEAAAAVLVAAAISRAACLLPLALLPAARSDGAGVAASGQDPGATVVAFGVAGLIVLVLGSATGRLVEMLVAGVLTGAAVLAVCHIARRQIGGQTGDVTGAAQQIAEIVVLVVLSAAPSA